MKEWMQIGCEVGIGRKEAVTLQNIVKCIKYQLVDDEELVRWVLHHITTILPRNDETLEMHFRLCVLRNFHSLHDSTICRNK